MQLPLSNLLNGAMSMLWRFTPMEGIYKTQNLHLECLENIWSISKHFESQFKHSLYVTLGKIVNWPLSSRQTTYFQELWDKLGDSSKYLRLVAVSVLIFSLFSLLEFDTCLIYFNFLYMMQVSLPNIGRDLTVSTMKTMFSIMESQLHCLNLWQVCL